ncbi:MAG: YCF48-related protein [Janthinobacterium lividum]
MRNATAITATARLAVSIALLFGARAAVALPEHFEDPLHTPSEMTPLAAGSLLEAVVPGGSGLVAVGLRGHILVQAAGSTSWKQAAVPVSDDLVAVSFPSPQQGWAVGHDGVVLHTADGGATWQLQLDGPRAYQTMLSYYQNAARQGDPAAAQQVKYLQGVGAGTPAWPFLDVWFRNDQQGYIVGAFGMIMGTTDGGHHWTPLLDKIDNPRYYHLYSIKGQGADVFIAGEHGLVLRLDDDAQRFVAKPLSYHGSLFGIALQGQRVVAYGLRGHAFVSSDRGDTWTPIDTGTTFGIVGATALGDGGLLLATEYGRLLKLAAGDTTAHALGTITSGAIMGITQGRDGRIVAATSLGPKTADLPSGH